MEARLLAILKGVAGPVDPADRLTMADLCYRKGLQATSARFHDEAFAERPERADNRATVHRYNAACSATLAGWGLDKDAPPPAEAARAGLHEKARSWLRADFAAWGKL